MREIAFRAWDSYKRRMVHNADVISVDYGKLVYGCYDDNEDYYELELMQYTGLKDNNGKEIYEGDILIHPDKRRKYKLIVEYKKTYCEEYSDYIGFEIDDRLIVGGNIYENPELLKED